MKSSPNTSWLGTWHKRRKCSATQKRRKSSTANTVAGIATSTLFANGNEHGRRDKSTAAARDSPNLQTGNCLGNGPVSGDDDQVQVVDPPMVENVRASDRRKKRNRRHLTVFLRRRRTGVARWSQCSGDTEEDSEPSTRRWRRPPAASHGNDRGSGWKPRNSPKPI